MTGVFFGAEMATDDGQIDIEVIAGDQPGDLDDVCDSLAELLVEMSEAGLEKMPAAEKRVETATGKVNQRNELYHKSS